MPASSTAPSGMDYDRDFHDQSASSLRLITGDPTERERLRAPSWLRRFWVFGPSIVDRSNRPDQQSPGGDDRGE